MALSFAVTNLQHHIAVSEALYCCIKKIVTYDTVMHLCTSGEKNAEYIYHISA